MQGFVSNNVPQAGPKNYVFVDEHNRHKRLKVMRACEGCRRRKIRCDSATTNTWPCAACTRLKLHCVPPVGGADGDLGVSDGIEGPDSVIDFSGTSADDLSQSGHAQHDYTTSFQPGHDHQYEAYNHYGGVYAAPQYFEAHDPLNGQFQTHRMHHQAPNLAIEPYPDQRPELVAAQSDSSGRANSQATITPIDCHTAEDLSEALGDLKINDMGVAPYIRQQRLDNKEPDGPIQEVEPRIAAFNTESGSHIRIPPALMPSDEDALKYFQIFFKDVHPYTPVLNRNQFYHQWHRDRNSISPLVLEAVFACAGRMSDDPAEGAQWLALANRHEACFLDTPRLSTLQALLLLLKARESSPKRGYYYRSWMTCKTIVTMAKDMELHEHHEIHSSGESCGSDPVECLTKTRIWQTAFVCEVFIGPPQGRTDMGVDPATLDVSTKPPAADVDEFEGLISRQFAYFIRNGYNTRLVADIAYKIKRKKGWALDEELVAYNSAFLRWPNELPQDLDIQFPADGSPPTLSSHFVGNMHCHYHLCMVMLRRPQLTASQTFTDDAWKEHMKVCYRSAKYMCRIQEGILAQYDLTGLLCMQRGINFTIYAILTCVMVHLIAICSPDTEFNSDAREYFVRHMRILERCVSAWQMPETEAQINGLRAAFSADLDKPFQLRDSFPMGTPPGDSQASPAQLVPAGQSQTHHAQNMQQGVGPLLSQQQQQQHHPLMIPAYPNQQMAQMQQQGSYLATPPVSAVSGDSKPQSPQSYHDYDVHQQNFQSLSQNSYYQAAIIPEQPQWNPTPIIDQFSTAFAIPASALAPPSSYNSSSPNHAPTSAHSYTTPSPSFAAGTYPPPQQPQRQPEPYYQQSPHHVQQPQNPQHPYIDTAHAAAVAASMQQQQTPQSANPYVSGGGYVTPRQWQQSVASVYDPGGLKRRWDGR